MANMSLFSGTSKKVLNNFAEKQRADLLDNLSTALKTGDAAKQSEYSSAASTARLGAQLAEGAANRRAFLDSAEKDNDARRDIEKQRSLNNLSFKSSSAEKNAYDIFGQSNADAARRRQDNQYESDRDFRRFNLSSRQSQQDNINNTNLLKLGTESDLKKIALENQGKRDAALIGAQGNVLGSLFSSVGSGNPNYRYWD